MVRKWKSLGLWTSQTSRPKHTKSLCRTGQVSNWSLPCLRGSLWGSSSSADSSWNRRIHWWRTRSRWRPGFLIDSWDTLDQSVTFKPNEEVTPDDTQETCLGKTRSKSKAQENINKFIKQHYANPQVLWKWKIKNPKPNPYDQLLVSINALKNLSIQDSSTQNHIKNLLINTLKDTRNQGKDIQKFMEKPHFPSKFRPEPQVYH